MTDMVERVARALDAVLGDGHESLSIEMGCGSHAKAWRAEAMREAAIAVLEELREPTEEMLDATGEIGVPDEFYRAIWRQMIDAALAGRTG